MMRRFLRSSALLAATAVALSVAGASPASAITGGQPDGEEHPNVGLILAYGDDGGRYRCSATLIEPTVLLTAAHCTDGTVGSTLVTFDSVVAVAPPAPFPDAADPSVGYTDAEITGAGYLSGTAATHPGYSDFTDVDNWNDVGLIVLDEPVTDIEPATIAPVGYLDQFASPALNRTLFEVVGYGTEVRKPEAGPQKPQPMSYPLIRRNTTSPGQKLTPQILQLQGNPNDNRGGGGTCFGDSGGPVFHGDYIVAVTSYTYTANCRYLGGYQRVDIPVVQDWLADAL
ncbi:pterin-4-alpha-carbinolamine dehydratase [Arthrobacter agilis]|uniref:Pterin-4-alpha-carbinolamine dehydratase n=2 Tax=Arthrobacter agilis TaxID=37921 RepID=A0A2L0UEI5_9MICC|nr:pterin-4-alpha-carbinolamine dehydratase [Arthrobacter agilis]